MTLNPSQKPMIKSVNVHCTRVGVSPNQMKYMETTTAGAPARSV